MKRYLWAMTSLALAYPIYLHASIGDDQSSVQKDVDGMAQNLVKDSERKAKRHAVVTVKDNYDIHEYKTKTGYLRQYVSKSGIVFAATWMGEQPDFSQIFGRNYQSFAKAKAENEKPGAVRSRFRHVETSELVVDYGGHMKNLRGRAYLKTGLPSGVNLDEIQ